MVETRKQIVFDLDTKALESYYTSTEITNILDELVVKNPWLNLCMRDCREANIGKEHSKNYIFDKNANVSAREELNKHGH